MCRTQSAQIFINVGLAATSVPAKRLGTRFADLSSSHTRFCEEVSMRYCQIFRRAALACVVVLGPLGIVGGAQADDKAIFHTNWRAPAQHRRLYQALANGRYQDNH